MREQVDRLKRLRPSEGAGLLWIVFSCQDYDVHEACMMPYERFYEVRVRDPWEYDGYKRDGFIVPFRTMLDGGVIWFDRGTGETCSVPTWAKERAAAARAPYATRISVADYGTLDALDWEQEAPPRWLATFDGPEGDEVVTERQLVALDKLAKTLGVDPPHVRTRRQASMYIKELGERVSVRAQALARPHRA